ncbi:hypothetical protein MANES_13G081800v8 [Manihot esculenta]|uniref:Uncharacterized protein n=1 Tax=Manihot esculenta TaxID=3983 RepID=A0ACB7GMC6_MANES|nr:hypothetical protein MANES_13G081800v8 [Manihot esculenta]
MDNLLLFFTLFILGSKTATASLTSQQLDSALFALRSRGYTLFPNAITTSDLRLLLLSLNFKFTLFSPPDPLIYSLDLSSTAPLYIRSLLRHMSPLRLSMSDLRSIRGSPYLDTLVPPNRISINKSIFTDKGTVSESLTLDGVRVSVPDIFIGTDIAVHGLEGILVAGVESNFQEEHIDRRCDPPLMSPVASWSRNSPASSPTAEAKEEGWEAWLSESESARVSW